MVTALAAVLISLLAIVTLVIFGVRSLIKNNGISFNLKTDFKEWLRDIRRSFREWLFLAGHLPISIIGLLALWGLLAVFVLVAFWGVVSVNVITLSAAIVLVAVLLAAFIFALQMSARSWGKSLRWLHRKAFHSEFNVPDKGEVPGLRASLKSALQDNTRWRTFLYALASFPLAAVGWGLSTLALWFGLAWTTYPLYWRLLSWSWGLNDFSGPERLSRSGVVHGWVFWADYSGHPDYGTHTFSYWAANTPARIIGVFLAGLVLLGLWPLITHAFTKLLRLLGEKLLGATEDSIKVTELQTQRANIVSNADERLRQIERDIHDGTQAQLTTIAMQIGEARDLLENDGDVATAASILATAHEATKEAMSHLREIASGVRPASLDSGLVVALHTLCSRSSIPVELETRGDIDTVDPRVTNWTPIDLAIRSIAYYTVNELLANAAKHSDASKVWLRVSRPQSLSESDELIIQYIDNGRGGARVIPQSERTSEHGTGLAGLADRLATVDGTMQISSPLGGQTIILVTLPATLQVKWSNEANAYV